MKQQDMRIEVVYVKQNPDYGPLARHLLEKAIAFYQDPENEKAFQKWLAERKAKQAEE